MSKLLSLGVVAVLSGLLLTACSTFFGGDNSGGENTPAAQMLPQLSGYEQVEGQTITEYLGTVSGGAALISGRPDLAVTIAAVDGVINCYQGVGAVRARVYSEEANPLNAGAVAVADRAALTDPVNFFNCIVPNIQAQGRGTTVIEPCTANYTLEKDDNTFYIIYAGTTPDICQAFCSQLEGCTAHR